MDFVLMLHSHLPYVLHHGRWPHGSDWLCEAAIDTYLPLLQTLDALEREEIPSPMTIGITPILASMLSQRAFVDELEAYFAQRLAHCDEAPVSLAHTRDEHLLPLVPFWRDRLTELRRLFHAHDGNLVAAFARHAQAGRIELTSSAATHAFLPMLGTDESVHLQLAAGRAEHERLFDASPSGCWIPECAYRPREVVRGARGQGRIRPGIESYVRDAGYSYFFVDAHTAGAGAPLGVYALPGEELHRTPMEIPVATRRNTPYRVYEVTRDASPMRVLVRDPRSTSQVWSRHHGYPGDPWYLEFHKIRWPGGLRLWRVSDSDDLGMKAPYEPATARGRATEHARHFVELLGSIARDEGEGVVVAPFDTELFGHWWFEGAMFLHDLFARLARGGVVRAATASEQLTRPPNGPALRLASGSWGKDGDYSMWTGAASAWTWPVIHELEDAFWSRAPEALARPDCRAILAQAARSLLLLQSSDWQFIMSTGEVTDYATRRFRGHESDLRELLLALGAALAGQPDAGNALASSLYERDHIFPNVLSSVEVALDRAGRVATV